MDIFYNPKAAGDVLIIPIKDGDRYTIRHENYGDVTKITDEQGDILGYNLFSASTYVDLNATGKIAMNESLLHQLKEAFTKNNLHDSLDFDLSSSFVVGYVKEKEQHENADKLSVCQVDTGDEQLQIVCGAPNVEAGQKVVVAKVGAVMPGGMKIKATELRGVPSNGMICSQKELGLPGAPEEKGIYVLDESYETGQPFEF
ncbi:YtpR family tRNA-binding protein [Lentibacillus juripiscarius]|uniref:YtpR family tRNA-binding protein n=1 Tax=Lentibacillus juripiscarius TaxID=257446 RepID=A0ABW5V7W2_9BACI